MVKILNMIYEEYVEEWFDLNKNNYSLRKIAQMYGTTHSTVSRTLKRNNYSIKIWHSGKFVDISKQVFGKLTAIKPLFVNSNGEYVWECYCSCNNKDNFPVNGTDLRRGRKSHCGCANPLKFDLNGMTFGYLEILGDSRERRRGHVMWDCLCICGEEITVSYQDLTSGHTSSCGCKRPKGTEHHNWGGGNSEVKLYVRSYLKDWKERSLRENNYRCVISNDKKNLEVHHLIKPFYVIFQEALQLCNLPIKTKIKDYLDNELDSLISTCLSLHFSYGLGVPITKELHKEFHSVYGSDTTIENFEEFKIIKQEAYN